MPASGLTIALGLSVLLAGCSPVSTKAPGKGLILISEQEEFTIGDQFAEALASGKTQGPVEFIELDSDYLDQLGQELAAVSKRPNVPYHFYLINEKTVNAFAVPGHIYVYRGLVEISETESEFASVLGHEIGHVVGRHSAKNISRAMSASLGHEVLMQLIGAGNLTRAASSLILTGAIKKYGRDEERQSDLLGVEECIAAGIDPRGAIRIFTKFQTLFKEKPNAVDAFFADHPYSAERADNVEKYIQELDPPGDLRSDRPVYQRWRATVLAWREPTKKI